MTAAIFAVSGNRGSGKTTAATFLSRVLDLPLVSSSVYDSSYVADQNRAPSRWSFEAQIAFLGAKGEGILEASRRHDTLIVDRSIEEEAQVFARYWHEVGKFDERAYATYLDVARQLSERIPRPRLVIHCWAPAAVCHRRVRERDRRGDRDDGLAYFQRLEALHREWLAGLPPSSVVVTIDTTQVDVRTQAGQREVLARIGAAMPGDGAHQMSLLDQITASSPAVEGQGLRSRILSARTPGARVLQRRVYVAAPFTGEEKERTADPTASLFGSGPPHGEIGQEYRKVLTSVARRIATAGFDSFLPHRDVNDWGRRVLPPEQVLRSLFSEVRRSDVFFGVLGNSYGAHMEAGVALSAGLPIVLVRISDRPSTFVADGLYASGFAALLHVETLTDLPSSLDRRQVERLVREADEYASNRRRLAHGRDQ